MVISGKCYKPYICTQGREKGLYIKLKKISKGFILYSPHGHSHFKNKKTANKCRCLIEKGIYPNNKYFQESCRRLLSKEDLERLRQKRKKDKYININKGRSQWRK